jgi:aryl-alcohol dehydrogenase-like predicted oxidoreductase
MTDKNYDKVEALEGWAKERGHTMGELAHAWLLAHPEVSSVISGATNLDQIKANAASASWQLSTEELAEVNKLLE